MNANLKNNKKTITELRREFAHSLLAHDAQIIKLHKLRKTKPKKTKLKRKEAISLAQTS